MVGKAFFGGEFPSSATIPRLYFLHVLSSRPRWSALVLHMAVLMRQKHTEPRGTAT